MTNHDAAADKTDEQETEHLLKADSDHVIRNCPSLCLKTLWNFIDSSKEHNSSEDESKHISDEHMFDTLRLLSDEQRDVYNSVLTHIGSSSKQLLMFISGESGVGKSHLIKVLAKGIRLFHYKQSLTGVKCCDVLVTSTSVGGAFTLGGLLWQKALIKSHPRVSVSTLSKREETLLQYHLGDLSLLIIDDISLLSLEALCEIDRRLCVAKEEFAKPFGGVHIVLCGDLFHLRPISGTSIVQSVFVDPEAPAARGRALFEMCTHYAKLTDSYRFKGTLSPLAKFVREARLGKLTRESLDVMNSQVVHGLASAISVMHPKTVFITSTQSRVQTINSAFLQHLVYNKGRFSTRLVATYRALRFTDNPLDVFTRQALAKYRQMPLLAPHFLDVCVGTRVRLTSDLAPSLGLFTGVMGTVCGLLYGGEGPNAAIDRIPTMECSTSDDNQEQPVVLVRIDGTDDDVPFSCSRSISRLIPVVPVKCRIMLTYEGKRFNRFQYPFLPAHGRTVHSLTGLTPSQPIVVDDMGPTHHGLHYVALSRARDMSSLRLLGPLKTTHFTGHPNFRTAVHAEYTRLSVLYDSDTFERIGPPVMAKVAIRQDFEEVSRKRERAEECECNCQPFKEIRAEI